MRKNSEIIAQHSEPWWAGAMKNLIYLLLIIALMVAGSAAQAQQPAKIRRIEFLSASSVLLSRPALKHSVKVCVHLFML